jgi:hypothetical protein
MGMEEELRRILERLDEHERRLKLLEEGKPAKKKKKEYIDEIYEGLVGGIRYLIDHDFFKTPKSIEEIFKELTKKGYIYPKKSVGKVISVDFMKKEKILNRLKEGKVWKYALRK